MKQKTTRAQSAFTLIEVLVVIVVLVLLAAMALPFFARAKAKSPQASCLNNLHLIGNAYRVWSGDHGERFPSEQFVPNRTWQLDAR